MTPIAKSAPAAEPSAAKARSAAQAVALPEVDRERLDDAIADLRTGARAWAHLTRGQRVRLFDRLHASTAANAQEWAGTAALSKGLEPGHALRGEEWLSGPYAALVALEAYRASLAALAKGASPLDGVKTDAAGGRLRAHTFPRTRIDGLLLSGYTGEVWFEPGVTEADWPAVNIQPERHEAYAAQWFLMAVELVAVFLFGGTNVLAWSRRKRKHGESR